MTRESERTQRIRQEVEARQMQLDVRNTQRGMVVLPTFKNALYWLRTDDNLKKLFQYNVFLSRPEVARQPPWGTLGDYPRPVKDADILGLKSYYIETYHVEFLVSTINEAVDRDSHCNGYDPVKDYLTGLQWDGKERVKSWLFDFLAVEPSEYAEFVGKMTLVAACARIDKPGVKYDYMLILEGEQNIGKSLAVKTLGGPYYREISMAERDKDTVERMQGAWLIEVAELAVFKKKDIESLKAFITCAEDTQRLPYGRRSEIFPRRNIFIGTINPDNNGYLSDTTGNRRFLPVQCNDFVKITELAQIRDQLWAEAWQIYQKGFPLYIPKGSTVADEALERQTVRQTVDEWQSDIATFLENKDKVTGMEIWMGALDGRYKSEFDRVKQLRVADCMQRLGWKKQTIWMNGKRAEGYRRKDPSKNIANDESEPWAQQE